MVLQMNQKLQLEQLLREKLMKKQTLELFLQEIQLNQQILELFQLVLLKTKIYFLKKF